MNKYGRLERLERATAPAKRTVFFWDNGDGLARDDAARAAEAEARGDEVMIFSWARDGREAN